jgi:hypothetical protein
MESVPPSGIEVMVCPARQYLSRDRGKKVALSASTENVSRKHTNKMKEK